MQARTLSTPLLALGLLGAAQAQPAPDTDRLIGSWQWTVAANDCTEIYSFEQDGSVATVSGSELTRQLFVVLGRSGNGRRLRVALYTVTDNGLPDCAEVARDDAGAGYEIWLEFSPGGEQMLMCHTEDGPECFGPLGRQRGI